MAVGTGNPFVIEPADYGQTLTGLADRLDQATALKKKEQRFEEAKAAASAAYQSGDPDLVAQTYIDYPELAKSMELKESATYKDETTRENAYTTGYEILGTEEPTSENITKILEKRLKFMNENNVPPEKQAETITMIGMARKDPEGVVEATKRYLTAVNPERMKKWQEARKDPLEALDPTNDQQNWETFKTLTGEQKVQFGRAAGFIEKEANPDPTDIDDFVRDGELCRGGDTAACARNEDRKGFKRAGPAEKAAVQLATDAAKAANTAIEKLPIVEGYIANLNEVKKLVDEGAGIGAIEGRLPSFRDSSVELDNIRNQLGLSVIQSATFGPLSEKELKFALETALPTYINDKDRMKKWVDRKIKNQKALLNYLRESAAYLSVPGNTRAGWLDYQEKAALTQLPEGVTNAQVIHTMDKYGMTRQEVLDRLGAK